LRPDDSCESSYFNAVLFAIDSYVNECIAAEGNKLAALESMLKLAQFAEIRPEVQPNMHAIEHSVWTRQLYDMPEVGLQRIDIFTNDVKQNWSKPFTIISINSTS
jgi:hypothetical protein